MKKLLKKALFPFLLLAGIVQESFTADRTVPTRDLEAPDTQEGVVPLSVRPPLIDINLDDFLVPQTPRITWHSIPWGVSTLPAEALAAELIRHGQLAAQIRQFNDEAEKALILELLIAELIAQNSYLRREPLILPNGRINRSFQSLTPVFIETSGSRPMRFVRDETYQVVPRIDR